MSTSTDRKTRRYRFWIGVQRGGGHPGFDQWAYSRWHANFSPANSVSIFLNDGLGGFPSRQDIPVQAIATAVQVADMNCDSIPDLAVCLRSIVDHHVGVIFGDGAGRFAPPVRYAVAWGTGDVACGDFDGDGDVDLAAVGCMQDFVSVLINLGAGQYASHITYPVGFNPIHVAIADLDLDGSPDLVVTNDLSAHISCHFGDGQGEFPVQQHHSTTLRGREIAVGDFDQDGADDIALGFAYHSEVRVFPGVGNGGLCGNNGPGRGCANSTGTGAPLAATGSASVSADDLVLAVAQLPAQTFGLVFMGSLATQAVLGNGLLCISTGGTGLFRFPAQAASANGALRQGPAELPPTPATPGVSPLHPSSVQVLDAGTQS